MSNITSVKAFLVYPADSYLNIDGAEIISAAALFRGILGERKIFFRLATFLPEIRKGPLLTCPLIPTVESKPSSPPFIRESGTERTRWTGPWYVIGKKMLANTDCI